LAYLVLASEQKSLA